MRGLGQHRRPPVPRLRRNGQGDDPCRRRWVGQWQIISRMGVDGESDTAHQVETLTRQLLMIVEDARAANGQTIDIPTSRRGRWLRRTAS